MKSKRVSRVISVFLVLIFMGTFLYTNIGNTAKAAATYYTKEAYESVNGQTEEGEVVDPSEEPSTSETPPEESVVPAEEPSEDVPPSLEPSETPEVVEDVPEEGEMPKIPETIVGEYLVPISQEEYEELLAAQPILSEAEEADELEKYAHTVQNEDGSYTKQIYFTPVRYQDENGVWQDIDTSLIQNKVDDTLLQSAAGEIDMSFATKTEDGLEVTIKKEDYQIAFKLLPVEEVATKEELDNIDFAQTFSGTETVVIEQGEDAAAKEVKLPTAKAGLQKGTKKNEEILEDGAFNEKSGNETITKEDLEAEPEVATNFNAVKHKGVLAKGIDVKMTPTASGVKEEIILNSPTSIDKFTYLLNLTDLYPVLLHDNNTILLDKETNEIIAMIPLPFMYETADEQNESYDIEVNIQKISDTEYLYQMIPSQEWLQAAGRTYPVVIDPSYNFNGTSYVHDTHVSSKKPNTILYGDPHLRIGRDSTDAVYRSFIYLNPTVIGTNKHITSATLDLYENDGGASTINAELHTLPAAPFAAMTWNNQPTTMESYIGSKTVTPGARWYTWVITDQVRARYNVNGGIHFRIQSNQEGVNRFKRFTSCRGTSMRPTIVINYVDAPPATTNLNINPQNIWVKNAIEIQWSLVPSPTGTSIAYYEYSITSATNGFTRIYNPTPETWGLRTWLDLPDGQRYVWLRAVNNYGKAGPAKQSSTPYYRDRTAPSLPASVTATQSFSSSATGKGNITVTWPAVTDVGSGVKKYYVRHAGSATRIDKGTSRTHTFTGLSDSTSYAFEVCVEDNVGNVSAYRKSNTLTIGDYTNPSAPATLTLSPAGWTNNTSPTLSWTGLTDNKGIVRVEYQINGGAWILQNPGGSLTANSITLNLSTLADGTHTIQLRGLDAWDNRGASKSVTYRKDTMAPTTVITRDVEGLPPGFVGIKATVVNVGEDNKKSPFQKWTLKYGEGTHPEEDSLITLAEGTTLPNDERIFVFDTTELDPERIYTLYLYAQDEAGNVGVSAGLEELVSEISTLTEADLMVLSPEADTKITDDTIPFTFDYKDETLQKEEITGGKLIVNREQVGIGDAKSIPFDATTYDNENATWMYPEGKHVFAYAQGKDGDGKELYTYNTYESNALNKTFTDLEGYTGEGIAIVDGKAVLEAGATEGYIISEPITFAGNVNYIDLLVESIIDSRGTYIYYSVSFNNGATWHPLSAVSSDGGVTMNPNARQYFMGTASGKTIQFKVMMGRSSSASISPSLTKAMLNVQHAAYSNATLINNTFDKNARGFTALDNVIHAEELGCIKMPGVAPYTGSIETTVRPITDDVLKVKLEVEQEIPEGASIVYSVSTDGGVTFELIDSTAIGTKTGEGGYTEAAWMELENPGKEIVLKATLHMQDGGSSPLLKSWRLRVEVMATGQAHMVELVGSPDNLSTMTDANYQTRLRWAPVAGTGIRYNVYRSETPYFVPSAETLVAEGIEEATWADYNLNFEKRFYYQVTATREIDGHVRESLPSNQAWATMPEAGEVQKRLGLQTYWSFANLSTGSGDAYVNVSNGNMSYVVTDMMVSDPFFAMVMRRTYNSMATTKTPMGYGWDFSFNTTLLKEYDENGVTEIGMILKDGDGSFHRFPLEEDGGYASAKGTFMKLAYDATADEYTITRKDNITYHFNAQSMKLKKFSNPNGNELTFTYDLRGNLVEIENTVGEKVALTYYVSKGNPGSTDFEYITPESTGGDYIYINENVDMIASIKWTEDTAGENPKVQEYIYTYGDDDKLDGAYIVGESGQVYQESYTYDTNGQIATVTNPESKVFSFVYDVDKRVSRINSPMSEYTDFVYGDNATTVRDKYGVATSYDYNAEGLVTKVTNPMGYEATYTFDMNTFLMTSMSYKNKINGATTETALTYTYGYDGNGNVTNVTGPMGSETVYENYNAFNKPGTVKVKNGSDWQTTSYTYDNNNGNLLTTTDPAGKVSTNTYGTVNGNAGYLLSQTDRLGKTTSYTYDSKGRVTHVSESAAGVSTRTVMQYVYDGWGRTVQTKELLKDAGTTSNTSFVYDKLGRLTSTTNAAGNTSSTSYSLIGNKTSETNALNRSVSYTYDDLNRVTAVTYPDGSVTQTIYEKWDSDSNGSSEADKVTTRIVTTDGSDRTSIAYYDKIGRLVKETAGGVTTQYQYDMLSNVIQVTDGAGRITRAQYDALGRNTKQVVDPNGENIVTEYTYDTLGNQLTSKDALNNITTNTYDDLGRLLTVTLADGSETTYAYDVSDGTGRIKNTVTDANANNNASKGKVSETVFDLYGRKVAERTKKMDGTVLMQASFSYHASDLLQLVTRNDGSKEKYEYDNMGRVTSKHYYTSSQSTDSASEYRLEYTYTATGAVSQEKLLKNGVWDVKDYTYNLMERVVQESQGDGSQDDSLSTSYRYNQAGELIGISYIKEDNQASVAQGNGIRVTGYVYDTHGRIVSIHSGIGNSTIDNVNISALPKVREYIYATNGDLQKTKDYRGFDEAGNTGSVETVYDYNSYGAVNKMTRNDGSSKKEEYTMSYNRLGYITGETLYTNYGTAETKTKSYTYDNVGRLINTTEDGKTTAYEYDKVGNRTKETITDPALPANERTSVRTYTYNNLDQLQQISEQKNGKTKTRSTYTYDNRGNQVGEVNLSMTLTHPTTGADSDYFETVTNTYDLRDLLITTRNVTESADEYNEPLPDVVNTSSNSYYADGKRSERIESIDGSEVTTQF
ncbi:MAG: DNRLRE domain-containing protein [Christensenellaceae bacterium]